MLKRDKLFEIATQASAGITIVLIAGILIFLLINSWTVIDDFFSSLFSVSEWDPENNIFRPVSSIYGTLMTTAIAIVLAIPLSLIMALFLVEMTRPRLRSFFSLVVDLLAAIPSIIFGIWGLFVFVPFVSGYIQPVLQSLFPGFTLFSGPLTGIGIFTAGIILAIMITPFMAAALRDVFIMIPSHLKEAAYSSGATTWDVTRGITMKFGLRGAVGAAIIGLGRAIGETMAVAFVIGNSHQIKASLFAPGHTITTTLLNEFLQASEGIYFKSLVGLALILFLLSAAVQSVLQLWLVRFRKSINIA